MKVFGALLLAGGLLFGNSSTAEVEIPSDEPTSEEVVENEENTELTEQEKSELLDLLQKWVNGEIELDEATIQLIQEKVFPVVEENIDKLLSNYIAESEEKQKVTAVIMALLGSLCTFLVMLLFTKGIKKQNLKATINNETFSESSKIISKSINQSKEDIAEMRKLIKSNEDLNVKTQEMILQVTKTFENQINAIMGVLKLTYKEGGTDASETQEKQDN